MGFIAQIIAWINIPLNAVAGFLLSPIGVLPGWVSNTIISAVVGVLLLIIFKYTSNQQAIGRIRDDVKAHMLALKLYKDDISVTLRAQGRVFLGAFRLLFHALVPMLVMMLPVVLLLGQMGLWYQFQPLQVGQEGVVTMKLSGMLNDPWPKVRLLPMAGVEVTMDQIRVFSKREIYWKIKALEKGYHRLAFQVNDQKVEKELAVGSGFMRVSAERPAWRIMDIVLYPLEQPFRADSVVQSISIDYPERDSLTSGTDWWVIYFFAASLVFAFIFKPFLKVKI